MQVAHQPFPQVKINDHENLIELVLMITLSFVITIDQMRAGFQRIYDMMGDISIDVPQVQFNTLFPLFGPL